MSAAADPEAESVEAPAASGGRVADLAAREAIAVPKDLPKSILKS